MFYSNLKTIIEPAIYVQAGETAIDKQNGLLISTPLGSCVAIVIFDRKTKIGGMAHVMLPGKAPDNNQNDKNKYCYNAIENLLNKLQHAGTSKENMDVCLAGGANVLKKPDDTIACDMVNSVLRIVVEKRLKVAATALGGIERRTVILDTTDGVVSYTSGDSDKKILWDNPANRTHH